MHPLFNSIREGTLAMAVLRSSICHREERIPTRLANNFLLCRSEANFLLTFRFTGLYGRLDKSFVFQTTVTNVEPTAKQSRVLNPYVRSSIDCPLGLILLFYSGSAVSSYGHRPRVGTDPGFVCYLHHQQQCRHGKSDTCSLGS